MVRALTDRRADAGRTLREAAVGSDVTAGRRGEARRGIDAIDAVLESVEQHHLARRPRSVPPLPEWIATLEQEGGLSIPSYILGLRNTKRLHGALLDWQDELLNVALPWRARLAHLDEQRDVELRRRSIWGDVG
jgi:hypothetical protein